MRKGYIYILQNPAFRSDLVKIGMTTRSVDERAKELSTNTSVPSPFEIACFFSVNNCDVIESIIHSYLDSYRWSKNREFFDIPLPVAYKAISEVILKYQESTVVKQILLDPVSGITTVSKNSELNNIEIKNEDLVTKLEELKERNKIAEKRLGEKWVKNYIKIKNKTLPWVNQLLSRADIDENLRSSLLKLKHLMEKYMLQKESIFRHRNDLQILIKESEE